MPRLQCPKIQTHLRHQNDKKVLDNCLFLLSRNHEVIESISIGQRSIIQVNRALNFKKWQIINYTFSDTLNTIKTEILDEDCAKNDLVMKSQIKLEQQEPLNADMANYEEDDDDIEDCE